MEFSKSSTVHNGLLIFAMLGLLSVCITAQEVKNSGLHPIAVTGMSPTSGAIGTLVTITGTGFGASQGGSKVGFNGIQATPTSWSDTSIQVPVPSGATTGPVKVCVSGDCVIAGKFTVTPSITSLDPPDGPIGTTVTIIGTAFGGTQGTSSVVFNGTPVIPVSWSDTAIKWVVPSGASSGPIVVIVGGYASNALVFTVTD